MSAQEYETEQMKAQPLFRVQAVICINSRCSIWQVSVATEDGQTFEEAEEGPS